MLSNFYDIVPEFRKAFPSGAYDATKLRFMNFLNSEGTTVVEYHDNPYNSLV